MIGQKRYNLVFYGEIVRGHNIEKVKRKLSALFNVNMSKIERIFEGKPVMIKKNVEYKTALKYQIAFEWMGALCHIEPITKDVEEASFEEQQHCNVNVIFDGKIDKRYSVEEVKRNLRVLLKLNERRIEELFAGHPVVIMKDVDYHPALKIQTSFELVGAICRIEAVEQSPPDKTVEHAPQREIAQHTTYETMTCPRCGFEQRRSRKCSHCGIYVETYLKGNDTPKARRARQLAQKMNTAMKKELLYWGIGLIILGIIQFAGLGLWAFCIVIVGMLNLLVRWRVLFVVNGITVCVSGGLSLVFMTINTLLTNGKIVNAGTGQLELITIIGSILLISGVQMYVGVRAFTKFKKYASTNRIRHR